MLCLAIAAAGCTTSPPGDVQKTPPETTVGSEVSETTEKVAVEESAVEVERGDEVIVRGEARPGPAGFSTRRVMPGRTPPARRSTRSAIFTMLAVTTERRPPVEPRAVSASTNGPADCGKHCVVAQFGAHGQDVVWS